MDEDGLILALGKGDEGLIELVLNEESENKHPEELSNHPYLQPIAYERKKQIELAYGKLVGEWVTHIYSNRRAGGATNNGEIIQRH